ncbi:SPFH domain-containing protein [Patescibacteria group bacterium]|nr:SPFH domain-containing protein [Patescibacteria group bacterium]MBU1673694.1 SPFH domain-containing protein [Patescibacteria group bacterium]MBU1963077.1 SPFH domain-containing protein [Patescibacteria group bacterium]
MEALFGILATFIIFGGIFILVLLIIMIKQVDQYQRGLLFTMGKFRKIHGPGWKIVIPIFQRLYKVDIRVKAVDVPDQEAITKDNVSVKVNAVIYYQVADPEKAVLKVEDFYYAVSQLAQTTMRNVVGEVSLDELLANRDEVAKKIMLIVDESSDPWGINVNSVELKHIELPENLKRTMAKQAEAEREKRATIINSEGEVVAADNLAQAAKTIATAPGALHLRTLNSINDISSDQSNTVIFAVPLEVLHAFEGIGKKGAAAETVETIVEMISKKKENK